MNTDRQIKDPAPTVEFHISRAARDRFQFPLSLFSARGKVIFPNFHGIRLFADRMNRARDLISFPEQAVQAGQIGALGLIDEILHVVIQLYREQVSPDIFGNALAFLDDRLEPGQLDKALRLFIDDFPPLAVYRREITAEAYLAGSDHGIPHRQVLLEEMLLLWLTDVNPATSPYYELFDSSRLKARTQYVQIIHELQLFFTEKPVFGPDNQDLVTMLRSPAVAVPHSLTGQLEYIRSRWGFLIGRYLYRLLGQLDMIKEEQRIIVQGSGQARVYEYQSLDLETERFSPDKEWMPTVVLMAKNTFVWLDQLSRTYNRQIHRLDEIPDEELARLQRWGFNGLWLIGLWERSIASKAIKHHMGNPDAVASAYSLRDYQIASDLGGPEAYQNLRRRAGNYGIRLASDMVPNHMGIDSYWMMDHPDRFISLNHSPFPSYSFSGPNLSSNPDVGIYLEDHYYSRSDAAVVFKRVDHRSGQEKFIYHGNDGTNMPWNDTAQLDFLNPDTREAVVQTILHVARQFPIIRFDAAMTLAKKHYQRLWFPEPGSGGAIPSRADHGLPKDKFDEAFPVEFWREVVDRVAAEVPDTLLLAEAFWLMEGYFVRTLGMHRVYNSAFMNMLRDEENANYRSVMKNTLEFDADILKRFVNFMNNPDERTAVDQFGKGDKYLGVCILMATLPGLPMFGHGQIEGFTEKYGMEFRRANWTETPDEDLISRHQRHIFPLLHRRRIFAGVEHFLLYDFFTSDGYVNEDVYAYSNRSGDERALVLYHNKYADTRGWIRQSVQFRSKSESGALEQKTLGDGFGLQDQDGFFCIFRNEQNGLEYIRRSQEIHREGLYFELGAYQANVLLDFREVMDNEWHHYAHLADYLGGRGVPNLDEASQEIILRPLHEAFWALINPASLNELAEASVQGDLSDLVRDRWANMTRLFFERVSEQSGSRGDTNNLQKELTAVLDQAATGLFSEVRQPEKALSNPAWWGVFAPWLFSHQLGALESPEEAVSLSRSWFDEWRLAHQLRQAFLESGLPAETVAEQVDLVRLLIQHQDWWTSVSGSRKPALRLFRDLLGDPETQAFLRVNRYQDQLWFGKEPLEMLLQWLEIVQVTRSQLQETQPEPTEEPDRKRPEPKKVLQKILEAAAAARYQVEAMIAELDSVPAELDPRSDE